MSSILNWLGSFFDNGGQNSISNPFGRLFNLYKSTNLASGGSDFSRLIDALTAKLTGNELTGAEREANEFSASEAQKSRDFTEYMTRNKYQMETQSMQEAGVNPAMMYGGGNLVSTASNGAAATSAQPSAASLFDILPTLARLPAEIDLLKAQAEEQRASAENKAEGTKGLAIDNSWKDYLNGLSAEGQQLRNKLTKAQEQETYQNIETAKASCNKMVEEAKTESSKRLALSSEAALNDARAWQIAELLPYDKALRSAQTTAEKASAVLAFTSAAYKQGLIDSGYIDALVANTVEQTKRYGVEIVETDLKNKLTSHYYGDVLDGFDGNSGERIVDGLYRGLAGLRGAFTKY